MRFIANLLDDLSIDACGICDNCTGSSMDAGVPIELVAEAERFLLKRPIALVPKKQYYDPDRGGRRGIPDSERLGDGRTLAMWGDAGWGELVRRGKQIDGRFDDRLVEALAELIEEWAPEPAAEWITCVPSLRHPELVPLFAQRLASRLGLPFIPLIAKIEERPAQKLQQNSAHQQSNVEGAFAIVGVVPTSPGLLIDDIVDSTWTLTELGRRLRRAGASLVYPVALASSAGRN